MRLSIGLVGPCIAIGLATGVVTPPNGEVLATTCLQQEASSHDTHKRVEPPGGMRGQISTTEDFDEPLELCPQTKA